MIKRKSYPKHRNRESKLTQEQFEQQLLEALEQGDSKCRYITSKAKKISKIKRRD